MVEVYWANPEKNILLWIFPPRWTWTEFFTAKKQADAMIDNVEGIVDSIFLVPKELIIPSNAIPNLRSLIANRHKRHDLVIVVGSTSFLTALLNLILQNVPNAKHQFRFVQDQAEAYRVIEENQQRRADLPLQFIGDSS